MKLEWLEALRDEIERSEEFPVDQQTRILAEYLSMVAREWSYSLGVGDVTVRFARAVQVTSRPDNAFKNRLLETMKRAHAIRSNASEAQALLRSSKSFGDALLTACQTNIRTAEAHLVTFSNKEPLTIGVRALTDLARAHRLPFLKLFSLVAQSFESSFVSKRNELVTECLARIDKGLTQEERHKQSIQAAESLLNDEKQAGIDFLHKLAIEYTDTK